MDRTTTRLTALALAALAFGCTEPGDPLSVDEDFEPAATLSPGIHVLNTQLRGIIDPEIVPSPAWGHVQVKLIDDGEEGYRVQWKGRLFNPGRETFNGAFIINPDIRPAGTVGGSGNGDPPILIGTEVWTFFRGSSLSCGIIDFDSQGITDEEHMPVEIANAMIIDPDHFGVIIYSPDGPRVSGRFGVPDPTTVLGFNPQPDPPGKVRCAV